MDCTTHNKRFGEFSGFRYRDILGGAQEGLTRRDPSPVIRVGDAYYVWYSRTRHTRSGYTATIWYATSVDGIDWREQGEALGRGGAGAFDEHAVFTPSILIANGRYYLSYTGVPEPFHNSGPEITRTAIGMAAADSPDGPWERVSANPILSTSDDHDQFDSLRVDDTCFVFRNGEYWMYYKGRQWDRTPGETKMGVAIATHPEGPYMKHELNPVLDSGHEVCVWPHGSGVATLVCNVGPQGNTLQYAAAGIHFSKVGDVVPPKAPGPFRADNFQDGVGPGISWGISMVENRETWPHLVRFDCNLTATERKE